MCVEELNLLYNIQLQYRLLRSPAEHSGGHPVHALHRRMHSIEDRVCDWHTHTQQQLQQQQH